MARMAGRRTLFAAPVLLVVTFGGLRRRRGLALRPRQGVHRHRRADRLPGEPRPDPGQPRRRPAAGHPVVELAHRRAAGRLRGLQRAAPARRRGHRRADRLVGPARRHRVRRRDPARHRSRRAGRAPPGRLARPVRQLRRLHPRSRARLLARTARDLVLRRPTSASFRPADSPTPPATSSPSARSPHTWCCPRPSSAISQLPWFFLYVRQGVADALDEDPVRGARARGLERARRAARARAALRDAADAHSHRLTRSRTDHRRTARGDRLQLAGHRRRHRPGGDLRRLPAARRAHGPRHGRRARRQSARPTCCTDSPTRGWASMADRTDVLWRSHGRTRRSTRTVRVAVSAVIAAAVVLAVLLVPPLAQLDEQAVDLSVKLQPPSLAHPFGTDDVGRDLLLRCVYGLRVSLLVGLVAALVATVIGTPGGSGGSGLRRLGRPAGDAAGGHLRLRAASAARHLHRRHVPARGVAGRRVRRAHPLAVHRPHRPRGGALPALAPVRRRGRSPAARRDGGSPCAICCPASCPQAGLAAVLMVPHAMWHESALSFLGLGLPTHQASLGNLVQSARGSLLAGRLVAHALPRPVPDRPDPRHRGSRRRLARADQPAPPIGADAVTRKRCANVLSVRDLSVRFRMRGGRHIAAVTGRRLRPGGRGVPGPRRRERLRQVRARLRTARPAAGQRPDRGSPRHGDGTRPARPPTNGHSPARSAGRGSDSYRRVPAAHLTPVRTVGSQLGGDGAGS